MNTFRNFIGGWLATASHYSGYIFMTLWIAITVLGILLLSGRPA